MSDATEQQKAHLASEQGQQEFNQWLSEMYSQLGRYAHSKGAIPAEADGQVVWAVPFRLLLVRVWARADRSASHWVLGGGEIPSDVIETRLAATPREAVRHIALKWQLQAARVSTLADDGTAAPAAPDGASDVDWDDMGIKLAQQAEALYALTDRDDLWDVPAPDSA